MEEGLKAEESLKIKESPKMQEGPKKDGKECLAGQILSCFQDVVPDKEKKPEQFSPLVLAFIGDAVYSLIIRTLVVERGNMQVNKMHRAVSQLVKAQAQQELYHAIEGLLTEEEQAVFKRGRNAKSHTSAKNASITEYRNATGMEALVGYLYLSGNMDRILYLMSEGLKKETDKNE